MFIDFKITIWERAEVPDECKAEVLEAVRNGTITSIDDIFAFTKKLTPPLDVEWNYLMDYSDYMSLEENGQQCTVQAIEDESGKEVVLFDNSISCVKTFNQQFNIGKSKYVVNYYDGIKVHKDGGPFSDIAIFKNKKKLQSFIDTLEKDGYVRV